MKTLVKKGAKPQLRFTCGICKSEWLDDDFEVKTKPNPLNMFMPFDQKEETPASKCPTCGLTAYGGAK